MNAQSRLVTSFMVLCVFSQASWVQGQMIFPRVRFLKTIGDKTNEIKVHLIVTEDSIQVRDSQFFRTLKEIPYSEIKAATYSFSKHRRWRAGVATAVAVNVFATPLFFMKGKKHWMTFETEEDRLALRLDKRNFKDILSAVDRRLKDTVAFDGYREGASRIDTPSLENKGESTQDIERILVADQSAQAEDLARLRRSIMAYLEDLPNFICDYTEHHYERGIVSEWVSMDMNQGEVRYIDGRSDYRVMSGSGSPTGKTIWEVSAIPHSFGAIRTLWWPSANYRFTPQGEGAFSFQSDWGGGLVPGWKRDGTPLKGGRSYPSWGTVRVQEPEHRVLSVREYFEVPKRGVLARIFTSGFPPGEYAWFTEYGFVNIGEQPYWLVKQVEFTRASTTDRVVQTYDNCRRFEADSVIRYGDAVDASQPDSRLAPGDMGDEPPTPTPVLETGLEVGADRDAAKSPQISRQEVATVHPPTPGLPAAPQPPLSAVRTSPKRNAPFEGTPTDYVGGVGGGSSENSLAKPYGYKSQSPAEADRPSSIIPKSYSYGLYQPTESESAIVPKRYPNIFPKIDPGEDARRPWPSPPPRRLCQPDTKDDRPQKERVSIKKDQAGSTFGLFVSVAAAFGFFVLGVFVSTVGAFAFIRVFGGGKGHSNGGKAK